MEQILATAEKKVGLFPYYIGRISGFECQFRSNFPQKFRVLLGAGKSGEASAAATVGRRKRRMEGVSKCLRQTSRIELE